MNGEGDQNSWDEQDAGAGKPFDVTTAVGSAAVGGAEVADDRLALGDEERLPWLESADDGDYDEEGSGSGRLIGLAVMGLVVLAALIGGIWYATNRTSTPANADGSLIEASKEPYKVAPKDPGGKTFAGTGDSSFKVSEGDKPTANLAGSASPTPVAMPSAKPSTGAASAPVEKPATGGVGVQIGAFSSNVSAEAAWNKLTVNHEALKGLSHRVIEGKADIGTVYRLQAVSADLSSASTLCQKLQAGGLKCQVKR